MRIAERYQTETDDQSHRSISALHPSMHCGDRGENILGVNRQSATLLQFVGKDIEQDFRVGIGVDMAQVGAKQLVLQLHRVGQVAVVGQGDAKGRVDVERLGLGGIRTASGRVTHMADANIALQIAHVTSAHHVADQTVVLAQKQAAFMAGYDPGGILSPVLQHGQAIEQTLINRIPSRNADDSTHRRYPR